MTVQVEGTEVMTESCTLSFKFVKYISTGHNTFLKEEHNINVEFVGTDGQSCCLISKRVKAGLHYYHFIEVYDENPCQELIWFIPN